LEKLKKQLEKAEDGFGLKNVDIRTKLYYGDNYGVTVCSVPGEGTLVHIEIPWSQ
jgi:two-component system sensor histidine kinase YesM